MSTSYDYPSFMFDDALPTTAAALQESSRAPMEGELEAARVLGRPQWVAVTPVPDVVITDERLPMRKEVDLRFRRNEFRQAIRLLYALIDTAGGDAQKFAKYYIKEGLMWAGEMAFSLLAFQAALPDPASHMQLGMCYLYYRHYTAALEHFRRALQLAPESDTPTEMLRGQTYWSAAQLYQYCGDLHTAEIAYARAEESYRVQSRDESFAERFRQSQVTRANDMAEMVEFCRYAAAGTPSGLQSGVYSGTANGYSAKVGVEVGVESGRITRVEVIRQKESNPLTALQELPRRIVAEQSLNVQWIPGAKYTSRAILAAAFRALTAAPHS